jgi:hypothetical protein
MIECMCAGLEVWTPLSSYDCYPAQWQRNGRCTFLVVPVTPPPDRIMSTFDKMAQAISFLAAGWPSDSLCHSVGAAGGEPVQVCCLLLKNLCERLAVSSSALVDR